MQIDITRFIRAHRDNMHTLSSSVAESGRTDVGPWTWGNSMAAMSDEAYHMVTGTGLADLIDHFADYGAWDREDLEKQTSQELNALLVQFIAGDFQAYTEAKGKGKKAFARYQENEGGRLFGSCGRWYYYIGC